MAKHKKSTILLFLTVLRVSSLFAQTADSDETSDFDDLDSLFSEAEDVSEPVVSEDVSVVTNYNVTLGNLTLPLEFSGKMRAEAGLAFIKEDSESDAAGYFDFKNYLNFTSRPDKYIALKGTLKTSLPADDDDLDGQNNYLYIYELYFDYLMLDRIYLTAGKKKSVWGNIRLFSDTESYEGDDNALYTNILSDSRDHISGILKIPVGNHTFTGLAMYRGGTGNDSPKTKDLSLAASAEFVFMGTSLNFFGRRFPTADSEIVQTRPSLHKNTIVGAELKRTILSFDLYGQTLGRISENEDRELKKVFTSKFDDLTAFKSIVSTVGCYRIWNENIPYVGFNVEFQNIYIPEPGDDEKYFTNRFASYCGIAKLGPNKDLSIGFQWNHNITQKTGFFQPGINVSKILPHCDWRIRAKYEDGLNKDEKGYEKKLTVGTYLTISMDY